MSGDPFLSNGPTVILDEVGIKWSLLYGKNWTQIQALEIQSDIAYLYAKTYAPPKQLPEPMFGTPGILCDWISARVGRVDLSGGPDGQPLTALAGIDFGSDPPTISSYRSPHRV